MRAENQLKTFRRILDEYPQNTPLSKFLPSFYRKNKQMGSSDRRMANRLLYNFFRLGAALKERSVDERLFASEFLCSAQESVFLQALSPVLSEKIDLPWIDKINFLTDLYPDFDLKDVFPWTDHLSAGIDQEKFLKSFFSQPDLFIRLRKGFEETVKSDLLAANIEFKQISENCLALPNGTKLDVVFPNKRPFEVQDFSSQQTASYFQPKAWENWWDACAASGGKSLLLMEQEPSIKLVVSDIRESILDNLDDRFLQAGIRKYQRKIIDLTQNIDPYLHDYTFDGIILDAPCSGSGTWGRTPEMIAQFSGEKIAVFQKLQHTIALNVNKYLKPGKPLIYITCSVFKAENEDVVNFLTQKTNLRVEETSVLKGYENNADTMFVSRMVSN